MFLALREELSSQLLIFSALSFPYFAMIFMIKHHQKSSFFVCNKIIIMSETNKKEKEINCVWEAKNSNVLTYLCGNVMRVTSRRGSLDSLGRKCLLDNLNFPPQLVWKQTIKVQCGIAISSQNSWEFEGKILKLLLMTNICVWTSHNM